MLRLRSNVSGALVGALLVLSPAARAQDSVAAFYRGKQISLVIPSSPGGGYDLYGRLIARHIGRFIPGNPNVVPANMSGAAGVVATQYVYSGGAKDGTVIGEVYPSAILDPLLGSKQEIKYDPLKFAYIGSATADIHRICFVRAGAPIKNFEEAFSKEVVLGATGVGAAGTDYPSMYNHLLGTRFKIIPGYSGMTEVGLALERGEIDGTCGTSWSSLSIGHPEWLTKGLVRVLAQESLISNPDIAKLGAPLTIDFARTPEARQVMEFVYTQPTFGRPFLMSADVPAERVAAVRQAFSKALDDPELRAEAAAQKIELDDPMNGEELQATIARLMATPRDVVERTRQAILLRR